jgi:hypothetical protein
MYDHSRTARDRGSGRAGPDELGGAAGASARERAQRIERRRREAAAGASRTTRLLRILAGPSELDRRLAAQARNWQAGAEGEELLARTLHQRCPDVALLHDRRIPGRASNIDHIAFAPSGVYVIDAKRYRGKVVLRRPLFGAPQLRIAGRDRTSLLAALEKQVTVVRAALAPLADDVPVHGCLCFLSPSDRPGHVGLPMIRTLCINGFALYHPARLAKHLNRPGPLAPERARSLRNEMCARLPPAHIVQRG